MEIKRAITKQASRLTPQIEVMNCAGELREMVKRMKEILDYAEEKVERAEANKKRKESTGVRIDRERREEREHIAEVQNREAVEAAADQAQQDAQPGIDLRTEDEINAGREPAQTDES